MNLRTGPATLVLLSSVWVESPEGRGFTLGGGGGRIIGIQFQDQGVMTPLLGRALG